MQHSIQQHQDQDKRVKTSNMKIHWKKGISCYFDTDDITITVWASSWSGMESISIDGEVVSSFRGWGKSSSHQFEHAGIGYEVQISCQSLTGGVFVITLLREGVEIDSDQGSAMGVDTVDADGNIQWQSAVKKIGPVFLVSTALGMVFGYTVTKFFF